MAKDKGVLKRAIVTPDKHAPIHDKAAINVVKKAIEIVKPDIYIDLGDLGEWNSVSHWQWKRKKMPPLEYIIPRIDKDVKGVNELLDSIDESLDKANCKEKYLCGGNHDEWCNMFVDQHPYLPQYKFENSTDLKGRGYKYYPSDLEPKKWLKIGKLHYYHGHHKSGMHHAKAHLMLGANVMYGHHHGLQQASVTHIDGPKSAWSLGCLKDMSPEKNRWLGGKAINWAHAFAVVDYFRGGLFTVHIVQIINGKTSLWGELIDGNK